MANASRHLNLKKISGIGERSVAGALATLLSITSDGVLAFDGAGRVLLANDEAVRMLSGPEAQGMGASGLLDCDIRSLFPSAEDAPDDVFDSSSLPFDVDGRASLVAFSGASGSPETLVVRCSRVSSPGETYLLAIHAADQDRMAEREHDRLLEELRRANRRLSGTLGIVLGTLDSENVSELFDRVLEELCGTMDASGTIVYLAEQDGFRLRGVSASLEGRQIARFVPYGRTIERIATQLGRALRLRVLPPKGAGLRQGRLTRREVLDEETNVVHLVDTRHLPPFVSFLAVPVWFAGHVIAMIEVGWNTAHPMRAEDAELLDAVGQYLSVQLVGALASMRTQRSEELVSRTNDLRELMMADPALSPMTLAKLREGISQELSCDCIELAQGKALDTSSMLVLLQGGEQAVPQELIGAESPDSEVRVEPFHPSDALGVWLEQLDKPCRGALIDAGSPDGVRRILLALRPVEAEPFDDLELGFLKRVAEGLRSIASGEEGNRQERRISQALQTGMRNELQEVAGISAQATYSSATKSAFVGGDFYDLIRLPERRACVIMGDVSGKGVEAASVSAAVKTALGAYAWAGMRPAQMVRLLNDFLLSFSRLETFATLFVGIIDLDAAVLTYCSAGHPPALLVRAGAGELVSLGVQSGVVGAFRDMSYRHGRMSLDAGDVVLLYTDGTTEARAKSGAFFGEDGLRDAVVLEAPKGFDGLLDRLLNSLDAFTEHSLEDDVAMVALRFDEVGKA